MGTGVDMRSTTKTRVQRRVEKKQATLLVLLVLVIALVSFALGVIVGRHTGDSVVQQIQEPRRIIVAETPVVPDEKSVDSVNSSAEKLTFYDNLSKEEPAPIGSGINLPPATEKAVSEHLAVDQPQAVAVSSVKPPTPVAEVVAAVKAQPVSPVIAVLDPTPVSAPVPVSARQDLAAVDRLPTVSIGGGWVVQVFASRSAADAGTLRDKLNNKGYPAFIAEADLGKKGIWYRVLFGPYADKAAAVQAQKFAEKKDRLKGFAKRR